MLNANNKIIGKIYKASLKLLLPLTPEETYAVIVREAIKLVGGEFGSIVLEQNNELVKVYSSSPLGYKIKFRKTGFTYQAFKKGKVLIKSILEFKRAHLDLKKMGVKCCIFIPMSFQKRVIGTISINCSQEENYSGEMKQGLELFGSMATLAIRKSYTYKEIQEALDMRDLFISMAAHELRTPVTTIFGYAQLLESRVASFGKQEAGWVRETRFESSRLSMLIEDLLEISRIRANKLNLDYKIWSLKNVIEKVASNFNLNFPHRKLTVVDKLDKDQDLIIGDINKLIQVFTNLLDNAVKFSPADTEVVLALKYKKPYLVITIKDYGKGIAKEELIKIFNAFYQGQTIPSVGMGLGLFLCRNLIERHRGFINVSSKLNRGTIMEVGFPKAAI
ncbi:GAF domain-containing sensor histidine kinase [Candidatus Daviesbacteria bacterium]|nr:GAF domain-containing sensor histidine kinase [Candidatus Daviesbacteria bacterium]